MSGYLRGDPSAWGAGGRLSGPGGVWDGRAPVGATSRTGAPTVGYGLGSFPGASRWVVPQRGSVSGMRKKVIPFPPRKAAPSRPVTQGSRIS